MSMYIRKKYEYFAIWKGIYEMISNQRILRTVVALILALTTLFSMSSCLFFDFGIYEDLYDKYQENQNNQNQNPGENNNNNNNNDNNNSNENNNSNTNIPEFYPGSGNGNAENVPALQQTLLSTVMIVSEFGMSAGAGSGIIYRIDKDKGDAYIITNQHVVTDGKTVSNNIKVYLFGMVLETYAINATYIGGTTAYDIAVIKIEGSEILKNSYAKAADLGKSANVRVFDTVYAVGNPEVSGFSATQSIISVRSENLELEGADGELVTLRVMRVDAAVNHGNSGGGLYDAQGKLIGIVCAKIQGSDVDNMGYAIPIDLVKNLADNILYHCDGVNMTKLNRALLGITISAKVIGPVIDENGTLLEGARVQVMEVSRTSLAYGKVQIDDIVNSITVDGVTVIATEVYVIPEHMLTARVGSVIVMNVTRGSETFDITFTITEDAITLER